MVVSFQFANSFLRCPMKQGSVVSSLKNTIFQLNMRCTCNTVLPSVSHVKPLLRRREAMLYSGSVIRSLFTRTPPRRIVRSADPAIQW